MYDSENLTTLVGKKIRGIQSATWTSRMLVSLAYEHESEISDFLLFDCQSGKIHSLDLPPLHRGSITCIKYFPGSNCYNGTFAVACCDYGEQKMAYCIWEQKRLLLIAITKRQPPNCFVRLLPKDVFNTNF